MVLSDFFSMFFGDFFLIFYGEYFDVLCSFIQLLVGHDLLWIWGSYLIG